MRTGGTAAVAGVAGDPRLVSADAGGGPALLSGDICGGSVIPGYNDDDGVVDTTTKKGVNMTERVPVPSSEHVAEIVGRQGCKIKALRNKTNTYIKTPVRGEDPVFVVTGRQQDVDDARREILSAAEHFTQIRASRRHHASKVSGPESTTRRRSPSPGRPCTNHHLKGSSRSSGTGPSVTTTLGVRVPMSMVGLVVGPKGATIKRIQADTGTYIVTPGRDRDPVFEVIGSPDGVEKARQHIDAYIETRLAATSTNDRRELSFLRPAAGEVWSAGEADSMSCRFDAFSQWLALSADHGRPPMIPTPACQLLQSSTPAWSNLPHLSGVSPDVSHSDTDDVLSSLYARMLIAESCRTAQFPTSDDYWSSDVGLSSARGSVGGGTGSETGSFVPRRDLLANLYDDNDSGNNNHDDSWNAFSGFSTLRVRSAAAGDDFAARSWRLRPDANVSTVVGGGSDGATSPSCSPAESFTGSSV